ncbi:MAG: hypothetical protein N3B01_09010 [Verrucomicrobiae bacterium]|nr:hypothetical protein [Verrucomicrobiae bacterium]
MQTQKILSLGWLLLAGCAGLGGRQETTLRFHEQISSALPEKMYRSIAVPAAGLTIMVDRFPVLTERDVGAAELYPTAGGSAILLRLEPQGTMRLNEMTTRSRGRYLVIFLNGRPVAAWFMDKRIDDGVFLLEGDFTEEEARKAVESLNRQSKRRNSPW